VLDFFKMLFYCCLARNAVILFSAVVRKLLCGGRILWYKKHPVPSTKKNNKKYIDSSILNQAASKPETESNYLLPASGPLGQVLQSIHLIYYTCEKKKKEIMPSPLVPAPAKGKSPNGYFLVY
jgi:hypothetical protein